MTAIDTQTAPVSATLRRNLGALAARQPDVAKAIAEAPPREELAFTETEENAALSATLDGYALASQRRPLTEASRLAETVDHRDAGAIVVLGFGLGHHVKAIAAESRVASMLVVYEPDVSLLHAVLSKIDHSEWLARTNVIFATDARDGASLTSAMRRQQGLLAMGVRIVEHPPSRRRLGADAGAFCETFSRVLAAVRTTVVTTLVQSEATVRNFLGNVRPYVERPGIADLAKRCVGIPAITVAAGPSLARNIELLKTPGLRERCVIIAAQTVLKPLLAEGIRPHFVTSLDFHEISARFYEGLTADDVADTTLIVEPKANPAVVRAYPGPIRMPAESTLDLLLGPEIAGDHGAIRAGSTVAHLSYFVARLLGCDPVIMIGQDLGFTDGLYYADGASIHDVWSGELNEFRTLEMLEWERIARHRLQLRKVPANEGGEIYTDEQMATYLAEFERVILEDARAGRTTIDATEGGARKSNAEVMTLAEAIQTHAPADGDALPDLTTPTTDEHDQRASWKAASDRITDIRRDIVQLGRISRETATLLARMLDHVDDPATLNRLIKKSHKLRDDAMSRTTAFGLVQRINQLGAFKRLRADREISLTGDLTPQEKQKRQIERDRVNVQWIADASDTLVAMLGDAVASKHGTKERTHSNSTASPSKSNAPSRSIGAIVMFDPDHSALGVTRDAAAPIAGRPAIWWTLSRLARTEHVSQAVVVTPDAQRAASILADSPDGIDVEFVEVPADTFERPAAHAARLWSRTSWRGGLGNATCHDENFLPNAILQAMEARQLDGALLLGADWTFVDPHLCDDVITRWRTESEGNLILFSQAPPGLCPCVIDRSLLEQLAQTTNLGVLGTIGGVLGYHPRRPTADPIAQRACMAIDPAVRDAHARFIVDDPAARRFLEAIGDDSLTLSSLELVKRFGEAVAQDLHVEHLVLDLCDGRPEHGVAPMWSAAAHQPWRTMPRDDVIREIESLTSERGDAVITFAGSGDPLLHPEFFHLITFARERGVAGIHVRTPLQCDAAGLAALQQAPIDVLSVDLFANTAEGYERLTGVDGFRRALENIDSLIQSRQQTPPDATPWIVPRITRCESSLDDIEAFYDKWMIVLGAAVIDPLPADIATGRVRALRLPQSVRAQRISTTKHVAIEAAS